MGAFSPGVISRRSLLLGAAAAGVASTGVVACVPRSAAAAERAPSSDPTDPTPAPGQVHTVGELLASTPFFVAHRGSGDNWPEHTMAAYAGSVAAGAGAIEVSVCATADGVLVCHHDLDLRRMSQDPRRVADLTWAELQQVQIDARAWLGPNVDPEPIPRLSEVLDAFATRRVIFIEDKQGTNTTALLDLMDQQPDATEHFVWKQWAGARQRSAAAARGYRTWGYLTSWLYDDLTTIGADFDLLGVHHRASDAQIAAVVALGKPVVCWEVHYRSVRDRLLGLGVQGMMASNLPYVAELSELASQDSFGTGRRAAGDLPWTIDHGWGPQPTFDPLTRSVALAGAGLQAYHLGSMAPLASLDSYRLRWEMRWPEELPASGRHAGISFGQADDSDYRPLARADVAGYHLVVRTGGSVELYSRAAGETGGTRLAAVATQPARPGEWMEMELTVSPRGVSCSRQGRDPWTLDSEDTRYRGGYFSLTKNYRGPTGVEFRGVSVEPV